MNLKKVEELLNRGKITKKVSQELTYRDIGDSVGNVWSALYATGYLTGRHVDQADADIFSLWIPNGEIRKLFYELVEDWYGAILLHKPHPQKELKAYQIKQLIEILEQEGLI